MAWLKFNKQKEINTKVEEIFKKLAIARYPKTSLLTVIKKYSETHKIDISVQRKDFREYSYQIFGAIDVNDEKKPIIYINQNKPPNNQRFTLAHEFGHYVLGHTEGKKTKFRLDFESNLYPQDPEIENEELEANYFAAVLLMPEVLIQEQIKHKELHTLTNKDIQRLREFFNVSEHAMRNRLAWMQRENNPLSINSSNE